MKKLLICMITCSLLACGRTDKVTDAPFEDKHFLQDIEAAYENPQKIYLSEFSTNITYIPLETKEQCMIRPNRLERWNKVESCCIFLSIILRWFSSTIKSQEPLKINRR